MEQLNTHDWNTDRSNYSIDARGWTTRMGGPCVNLFLLTGPSPLSLSILERRVNTNEGAPILAHHLSQPMDRRVWALFLRVSSIFWGQQTQRTGSPCPTRSSTPLPMAGRGSRCMERFRRGGSWRGEPRWSGGWGEPP